MVIGDKVIFGRPGSYPKTLARVTRVFSDAVQLVTLEDRKVHKFFPAGTVWPRVHKKICVVI